MQQALGCMVYIPWICSIDRRIMCHLQTIKGTSSPILIRNRPSVNKYSVSKSPKNQQTTKISGSPRIPKNPKDVRSAKKEPSPKWTGNFILMVELRKKIQTFRDIIDIPPCDASSSITDVFIHLSPLLNFVL